MIFIQLLVVGSVVVALIAYLLRSMVCRSMNDVGSKAVLITGCDTGIGHELARHLGKAILFLVGLIGPNWMFTPLFQTPSASTCSPGAWTRARRAPRGCAWSAAPSCASSTWT